MNAQRLMVKVLTSRLHSVSAGKWRGGELYLTSTWLACYTIPCFGSSTTGCYSLLCSLFSTSTTPSGQSHSPSQATVIPVPKTVLMCIVFLSNQLSGLTDSFLPSQDDITIPFPKSLLGGTTDSTAWARPGHLFYCSSRSINPNDNNRQHF